MQRYDDEVSGLLLPAAAVGLKGWRGEERGEVWRLIGEEKRGGEYGNVENEGSFVDMLLKNVLGAVPVGVVSLMAKDGFGESREAIVFSLCCFSCLSPKFNRKRILVEYIRWSLIIYRVMSFIVWWVRNINAS